MKFKIYYWMGDYEDYYIVSGKTIKKIKRSVRQANKKHNLDVKKNNMRSEKIK